MLRSAVVPNCSASLRTAFERQANVIDFSTSGRTSLAFSRVVMMRPFTFGAFGSSSSVGRSVRNKALAKLHSKARWWLGLRPKTRPFRRCRMTGGS